MGGLRRLREIRIDIGIAGFRFETLRKEAVPFVNCVVARSPSFGWRVVLIVCCRRTAECSVASSSCTGRASAFGSRVRTNAGAGSDPANSRRGRGVESRRAARGGTFGVQRVSGAFRSCTGSAAGEAAAGLATGCDGGAHVRRSFCDAALASRYGEITIVCWQKEISGEVAMLCDKYKDALIE